MAFILGKKIEMTQVFQDDNVVPVTKIEAGPCWVTQIKTTEKDKYEAIQIGLGLQKKINKPLGGHLKNLPEQVKTQNRWLREFRVSGSDLKVGDQINVDIFQKGEKVKIIGTSKGKGFQGGVKRHGFAGATKSHGTKHALREPGSIGATAPQRVFKGMRMAGRMGGEQTTALNLEIIDIQPEKNIILVKGAVPGMRGSLLEIKSI
ncbi:MAG: 50S ribosomal protein L3 [Patescibacteria group bacterium]|nr:50S ribosomal protein L3 [Patescibacteria group bacterium]